MGGIIAVMNSAEKQPRQRGASPKLLILPLACAIVFAIVYIAWPPRLEMVINWDVQTLVYLLLTAAVVVSLVYAVLRIWPEASSSIARWWLSRPKYQDERGIVQAHLDNPARESWRCRYHPEVYSQYNCVKCGAPLCGECAKEVNSEYYCPDCVMSGTH